MSPESSKDAFVEAEGVDSNESSVERRWRSKDSDGEELNRNFVLNIHLAVQCQKMGWRSINSTDSISEFDEAHNVLAL